MSSTPPRVTVIGSVNMDLVIRCGRIPRPGETVRASRLETFPGGKGANQAVAAARLGAETRLIGKIGDDNFGSKLQRGLRENGVNIEALEVQPNTSSGLALIHVSADGENCISLVGGANDGLGPQAIAKWSELITASDVILLQLEIPTETVLAAIRLARQHRIPVILDPAPPPDSGLPGECFEATLLTPNQTEAERLTGRGAAGVAGAEEAGRRLLDRGAKAVVVKLGAQGALLVSRKEGVVHCPSFPVTAVDSTAAGDAFNAALAVAMAQGQAVAEALRFACAAGAQATTRAGAQTSMPTCEEVSKLLASARSS